MLFGKILKRFLAVALAAVMMVPASMTAMAETIIEEVKAKEPVSVEGTRLTGDELPEGQNIVYFGASVFSVKEGERTVTVPIYRAGSEEYLGQEEQILIQAQDISALYGQDYSLTGGDKTETPQTKSILERAADGEYSADDAAEETVKKATESNAEKSAAEEDLSEEKTKVLTELLGDISQQGDGSRAEKEAAILAANGVRLSQMKELQTGKETRDSEGIELNTDVIQQLLDDLTPDLTQMLGCSCEKMVSFEAGETETSVTFKVMDDEDAEGDEVFSLTIVAAAEGEPYDPTGISVTIEDDEAAEHSAVSFDRSCYYAEDGNLSVTVKRTGALYSMASLVLKGKRKENGTAENAETETIGEIVFSPYEEEKEIELSVTGDSELYLCDLFAAEEGEYVTAEVIITEAKTGLSGETGEEPEEADDEDLFGADDEAGDEETEVLYNGDEALPTHSFAIKVDNKEYSVYYNTPGDPYGLIMTTDNVPIQVGLYVFPLPFEKGGWWQYGIFEGHHDNDDKSVYQEDARRGYLYYSKHRPSREGSCIMRLQTQKSENGKTVDIHHPELAATYYQYVAPDWMQYHNSGYIYSSSRVTSTQPKPKEEEYKVNEHWSNFNRGIYAADATRIENDNGYLTFQAAGVEHSKLKREVSTYVYGYVCMFKSYEIRAVDPADADFRVADDKGGETYQKYKPFTFKAASGAVVPFSEDRRIVYANNKGVNVSFSTGSVGIGDLYGQFGEITGYTITVSPAAMAEGKPLYVELNYPADFRNWLLQKSKQGTPSGSAIDFSEKAVNDRIKTLEQSMAVNAKSILFDAYFDAWIEEKQKYVYTDGFQNKTYHQVLQFQPTYKLVDVEVEILSADLKDEYGKAAGSFSTHPAGTYSTGFHAGDTLNLSVKIDAKDKDQYRTGGYWVSKDGKSGDTIRDTYKLQLSSSCKKYTLRPVVAHETNVIEVEFMAGAKNILSLQNEVMTEEELKGFDQLKGKTILKLYPQAKNNADKMQVLPYQEYSVNILINKTPVNPNKVYRPVIYYSYNQQSYGGQRFTLIGNSQKEYNKIRIGVKEVDKSSLQTYELSGIATMSVKPVRSDAQATAKTAAVGYNISLGNGQGILKDEEKKHSYVKTVETGVKEDGTFALDTIEAVPGEKLTLLLRQGAEDGQVREVTLPAKGGKVSLGEINLNYPLRRASVTQLSYRYTKDSNNNGRDLTNNTIELLDDTLKLTAVVEKSKHEVKEVRFVSEYLNPETKARVTRTFKAAVSSGNRNIYELTTANMLETFSDGEVLYVQVVELQEVTTEKEGKTVTEKIPVELPLVRTGLSFCYTSKASKPKNFYIYSDPAEVAGAETNVPLIGSIKEETESGKLTLKKIDWENNTGYTVYMNADGILFQTHSGSTPKQKLERFREYIGKATELSDAKKELAEAKKQLPEPGQKLDGNDLFKQLNAQLAVADADERVQKAKNSLQGKPKIEVSAVFCLAFQFVKDPKANCYRFMQASVTLGSSGSASKTWYSVIVVAPVFLNGHFEIDTSYTYSHASKWAEQALKDGDFDNTDGNIRDVILGSTGSGMFQLDVAANIKISAGVGVNGVASAKGYVSPGLQFQVGLASKKKQAGVRIDAEGGIDFDMLIMKFPFTIAKIQKGWGTLSSTFEINMFNGLFKPKTSAEGSSSDGEDAQTGDGSESGSGTMLAAVPYRSGAYVNLFGTEQEFPEELQPEESDGINRSVLLNGAAEMARAQLVDLEDGRELVTFIGARGSDQSSSVLYYSIKDINGNWSTPVAVCDNGHYQTQNAVLKSGDKVYIAWVETNDEYSEEAETKEQLQSLGAKMVQFEYDSAAGVLKDESKMVHLTDLPYMIGGIQLSEGAGCIYCSYLVFDLNEVEEDADVLNLDENYHSIAITEVDEKSMEVVPFEDAHGILWNERIIYVEHPEYKDPAVLDAEMTTMSLGEGEEEQDFLLYTYTLSSSLSEEAAEDRELYLQIEKVTNGGLKSYYPVRLTNNDVVESCPTLTELNGRVYLTWIEGNTGFRLMDLTSFMETLFDPGVKLYDPVEEEPRIRFDHMDAYLEADAESRDWYKKTAAELGVDTDFYENSIYKMLCDEDFTIDDTALVSKTEAMSAIHSHYPVSDGKDIYIYYTELSGEQKDYGVDLYGVRYKTGGVSGDVYEECGFTYPVQLTDNGLVMDEISLYMDEEQETHIVSSLYKQSIDEDGNLKLSDNSLTYTQTKVKSSLKIKDKNVDTPEILVPGSYGTVQFDVVNDGMKEAGAFNVKVTAEKDGQTQLLSDQRIEKKLAPNEITLIDVPWQIPEDVAGTKIRVVLTEDGEQHSAWQDVTVTIEETDCLEFEGSDVFIGEDGLLHVTETIANMGNTASGPMTLRLYGNETETENESEEEGETGSTTERPLFDTEELESLAPGESRDVEFILQPAPEDFNDFGIIDMKMELAAGENVLARSYPAFSSSRPVALSLNDGAETIALKTGTEKKLQTELEPWGDLTDCLSYSSSDESVTEVSEDGTLKAKKAGKATIYVYAADYYLTDSIQVEVSDDGPDDPEDPDEPEYGGSTTLKKGPANAVRLTGSWKQNADGSWSFVTDSGKLATGWGITGYGNSTEYWHFNEQGIMDTGWYLDSDGSWYYLHEASDGRKGAMDRDWHFDERDQRWYYLDPTYGKMKTGWVRVNGTWYYLSNTAASPCWTKNAAGQWIYSSKGRSYGSMYADEITPDGYKVDKNGAWIR